MKVIVIGGGVIGMTTAYYLQREGAEVVLLDKNPGPALESSFANAGSMTATRAGPWASPKTLVKTLKGYFSADSAFRLKLGADPAMYEWLAGFCVAAFSSTRVEKRRSMIELGIASIHARKELDARLALDYGGIQPGLLTIYKNDTDFKSAVADVAYLRSLGTDVRVLTAHECKDIEPAVDWGRLRISGGVLAFSDESGDCHRFTHALSDEIEKLGVQIHYNETVKSLDSGVFGACEVATNHSRRSADAVVVAAGIQSGGIAKQLGIKLPVYPVKGYSVGVNLPASNRPKITISDESRKVFVTPMGEGVRAAGIADIVGYNRDLSVDRIGLLKRTVGDLYPASVNGIFVDAWAGLRAMTHDGPPIICGVPNTGIWFNTGHGSLGWTFSCGAASLVAKLVTSRTAEPSDPYLGLKHRW